MLGLRGRSTITLEEACRIGGAAEAAKARQELRKRSKLRCLAEIKLRVGLIIRTRVAALFGRWRRESAARVAAFVLL